MKISPRNIEAFIKKPDPEIRVILIYGPDHGLVKERLQKISFNVVSDINDPFNVSVIEGDSLADDPARLSDEANAISMMGGNRLVRVERCPDNATTSLKNYLSSPNPEALVVIEASELTPRSALRKLCEASEKAAAIPCYVEDERSLPAVIRSMAEEQGYSISRDALQWLASNLQGDRGRVRSETEKLMLYMGKESYITLGHARECCGEAGVQNLDTLVYAVADNNPVMAIQSFLQLKAEGIPEIASLRALQNHFRRMHFVKLHIDSGENIEKAIKSLQPPVFFKLEDRFRKQVTRWSLEKIELALKKLSDLEADSKKSSLPVETLCSQTILGLSRLYRF
jgi:DNA polymerase-3 subunit delta